MTAYPKPTRLKLKAVALKNQQEKVFCRDRHTCQLCSRDVVVPEAHHVIFKSQGGDDSMENLLTLCFDCHIKGIHGLNPNAHTLREQAVARMQEINEEGK